MSLIGAPRSRNLTQERVPKTLGPGNGGSHNMEVGRQAISLFYCRKLSNRWGKLLATRKRAPIQVPKSWR